MEKTHNIHDIVDYLNGLLQIDKEAVSEIFTRRVECNEELADHPTVQVGSYHEGEYIVGALGIMNGLFTGDETISMSYDKETRLILNFAVQRKSDFK